MTRRKPRRCLLCPRKAAPGSNVCTACYYQQYPRLEAVRVCGKDKREPVTRAELRRLKERHRVLLTRLRRHPSLRRHRESGGGILPSSRMAGGACRPPRRAERLGLR